MSDLNALALPELFARLCAGGHLARLIELAREEDLADAGDVAGQAMFDDAHRSRALLNARSDGRAAGLEAVPAVLAAFAPSTRWEPAARDGDAVTAGQTLGALDGPTREILAAERTLLNLVGRLSGIATRTAQFVARTDGTPASIYDTRKTTPGHRALEKYAVRCGGGVMHRIGLFDAAMFKDNHIAGLTGAALRDRLAQASARARAIAPISFVEVEVDTLEQLDVVLSLEPGTIDIVLLDNMPPPRLLDAVQLRERTGAAVEFEASGGVTLDTVRAIAETGVERISVGELTHTVRALDVGLDFA